MNKSVVCASLVWLVALGAASQWVDAIGGLSYFTAACQQWPWVLGVVLWATLCAVVSRVFGGQAHTSFHLRVAALGAAALMSLNVMLQPLCQALGWAYSPSFSTVATWLLFGAVAWAHLRVLPAWQALGRARMAWLGAGLVTALAIDHFGADEDLSATPVLSAGAPLAWALRHPVSTEALLREADRLHDRAEAGRYQAVPEALR